MLTEKQLMEAVGYHCSLENCRAVERAVIAAYEAELLEQEPVAYMESGGDWYSYQDETGERRPVYSRPQIPEWQPIVANFIRQFKCHVGGDGEFWLHEFEDFYDKMVARSEIAKEKHNG